MKKLVVYLSILAAAITIVVGGERALTNLRALKSQVNRGIDDHAPGGQLIAVVQVKLRDAENDIRRGYRSLDDAERQLNSVDGQIRKVEDDLAKERSIIKRGRDLLVDKHDHYQIAGARVSRSAVANDLAVRLGIAEQMEARVTSLQRLGDVLRFEIDDSRAKVAKAEIDRQEVVGKLETLKVRLHTAAAQRELAKLSASSGLGAPDGELAKAMANLENHVRSSERDAQVGRQVGTVKWTDPAIETTDRVDAFLRRTDGDKSK